MLSIFDNNRLRDHPVITMNTASRAKRPYLSRKVRRQQLLETAAKIVEEQGWDKLNMSAVAQQARTSRQLIYQHFASLEELMAATGTHIFQQVYEETRAAIEERGHDLTRMLSRAQSLTMDLPAGRAQALWQVVAAAFPADHELTRFGRRMRHLITNLWQPAVAETFGVDDKRAAGISWMLIMAFWGGYRLVQDGELSKAEAIEHLNWIVTRVAASAANPEA